jgi:hypothetical protein
MRKAPPRKAARAKRDTQSICLLCAGTLAVRQAREADWLDRQSIANVGPRRPFSDDFFIWRIAQMARANGFELLASPKQDDGSAEACTFCKYRHRHYGSGSNHSLASKRSNRLARMNRASE